MRDPHLTQIILNIRHCLWEEGKGWGFRGGGGLERKWTRVAEKGDNEGRERQIGQNNILVGRFV